MNEQMAQKGKCTEQAIKGKMLLAIKQNKVNM